MSRTTQQHRPGYAGTWALSYILPIAAGLLLYLTTGSSAAAVIGTLAGFILFGGPVRNVSPAPNQRDRVLRRGSHR